MEQDLISFEKEDLIHFEENDKNSKYIGRPLSQKERISERDAILNGIIQSKINLLKKEEEFININNIKNLKKAYPFMEKYIDYYCGYVPLDNKTPSIKIEMKVGNQKKKIELNIATLESYQKLPLLLKDFEYTLNGQKTGFLLYGSVGIGKTATLLARLAMERLEQFREKKPIKRLIYCTDSRLVDDIKKDKWAFEYVRDIWNNNNSEATKPKIGSFEEEVITMSHKKLMKWILNLEMIYTNWNDRQEDLDNLKKTYKDVYYYDVNSPNGPKEETNRYYLKINNWKINEKGVRVKGEPVKSLKLSSENKQNYTENIIVNDPIIEKFNIFKCCYIVIDEFQYFFSENIIPHGLLKSHLKYFEKAMDIISKNSYWTNKPSIFLSSGTPVSEKKSENRSMLKIMTHSSLFIDSKNKGDFKGSVYYVNNENNFANFPKLNIENIPINSMKNESLLDYIREKNPYSKYKLPNIPTKKYFASSEKTESGGEEGIKKKGDVEEDDEGEDEEDDEEEDEEEDEDEYEDDEEEEEGEMEDESGKKKQKIKDSDDPLLKYRSKGSFLKKNLTYYNAKEEYETAKKDFKLIKDKASQRKKELELQRKKEKEQEKEKEKSKEPKKKGGKKTQEEKEEEKKKKEEEKEKRKKEKEQEKLKELKLRYKSTTGLESYYETKLWFYFYATYVEDLKIETIDGKVFKKSNILSKALDDDTKEYAKISLLDKIIDDTNKIQSVGMNISDQFKLFNIGTILEDEKITIDYTLDFSEVDLHFKNLPANEIVNKIIDLDKNPRGYFKHAVHSFINPDYGIRIIAILLLNKGYNFYIPKIYGTIKGVEKTIREEYMMKKEGNKLVKIEGKITDEMKQKSFIYLSSNLYFEPLSYDSIFKVGQTKSGRLVNISESERMIKFKVLKISEIKKFFEGDIKKIYTSKGIEIKMSDIFSGMTNGKFFTENRRKLYITTDNNLNFDGTSKQKGLNLITWWKKIKSQLETNINDYYDRNSIKNNRYVYDIGRFKTDLKIDNKILTINDIVSELDKENIDKEVKKKYILEFLKRSGIVTWDSDEIKKNKNIENFCIKANYNLRTNYQRKNGGILLLDPSFYVGIDLFETPYFHLFEQSPYDSKEIQRKGRVARKDRNRLMLRDFKDEVTGYVNVKIFIYKFEDKVLDKISQYIPHDNNIKAFYQLKDSLKPKEESKENKEYEIFYEKSSVVDQFYKIEDKEKNIHTGFIFKMKIPGSFFDDQNIIDIIINNNLKVNPTNIQTWPEGFLTKMGKFDTLYMDEFSKNEKYLSLIKAKKKPNIEPNIHIGYLAAMYEDYYEHDIGKQDSFTRIHMNLDYLKFITMFYILLEENLINQNEANAYNKMINTTNIGIYPGENFKEEMGKLIENKINLVTDLEGFKKDFINLSENQNQFSNLSNILEIFVKRATNKTIKGWISGIITNKEEKLKELENKQEEELKKKQEEELKKKQEEELKKKQEEELKKKQEEELKKKQEEDLKKKQEEELKKKQEEELKKKQEEESKKKQEEELKKKQQEELKKKQEELKKKQEEELKKKQEEELKKKQEEELKKKQEEDLKKKQEEDLKKKQEEERQEELKKKQEKEEKEREEKKEKKRQKNLERERERQEKEREEREREEERQKKEREEEEKLRKKSQDKNQNVKTIDIQSITTKASIFEKLSKVTTLKQFIQQLEILDPLYYKNYNISLYVKESKERGTLLFYFLAIFYKYLSKFLTIDTIVKIRLLFGNKNFGDNIKSFFIFTKLKEPNLDDFVTASIVIYYSILFRTHEDEGIIENDNFIESELDRGLDEKEFTKFIINTVIPVWNRQ